MSIDKFSQTLALFPGQGSQKVGMGKDLIASSDVARDYFERADKALGFSLSSICFDGPVERLTETEITQPAILVMSVVSFSIARATLKDALTITCAAGHSLGEYSALVAAGALTFEDAVQLVHKRGRYMQEAVPQGSGKMVAVLGKEVAEIESALAQVTNEVASIANINAPGQIVVAGSVAGVDQFIASLGAAKTIPLQVSAPFHCSLMKGAEEKLQKDLATLTIENPAFPVIANFTAAPSKDAEEIRSLLAKQVCGRVRWVESMEYATSSYTISTAVEFGAGNVLTGLMKRINNAVPHLNIYSGTDINVN